MSVETIQFSYNFSNVVIAETIISSYMSSIVYILLLFFSNKNKPVFLIEKLTIFFPYDKRSFFLAKFITSQN